MPAWYSNLSERDRRVVLYGGIAAAAIVLLGGLLTLNRNVAQASQRVASKSAELAFIQSVAPELSAAGPGAGAAASGESLVVLIDSSAREAGLGKSLSSTQPDGDRALRIRLDKAPFDSMVAWLARLSQQHGVRVDSAEIDSAGEVGLVNAGLVLRAP